MRETLEDFIRALDDERFADAHEIMEKKWKEYKKEDHPLTKLLKGFINGATAFELIKREKKDGAKRLWGVYEKYLPMLKEGIEEYALFCEADARLKEFKERMM